MTVAPSLEFVVRIGGESVVVPLKDLLCVKIIDGDKTVRIMPGTVSRALQLGATRLVEDERAAHEVAKDCANPPRAATEAFLFGPD